jgi:hypothetical protein
MEALRERLEPFKRAREARQAKRNKPASSEWFSDYSPLTIRYSPLFTAAPPAAA